MWNDDDLLNHALPRKSASDSFALFFSPMGRPSPKTTVTTSPRHFTTTPASFLKGLLTLGWFLAPFITFFAILRGPEFDWGYVAAVDIPLWLAFGIGGGPLAVGGPFAEAITASSACCVG